MSTAAATIDELLGTVDGVVVDKSRVVDSLLDLRLACGDDPEMVAAIDQVLGAVPGKTMVETSWYTDVLRQLSGQVALTGEDAPEDA